MRHAHWVAGKQYHPCVINQSAWCPLFKQPARTPAPPTNSTRLAEWKGPYPAVWECGLGWQQWEGERLGQGPRHLLPHVRGFQRQDGWGHHSRHDACTPRSNIQVVEGRHGSGWMCLTLQTIELKKPSEQQEHNREKHRTI